MGHLFEQLKRRNVLRAAAGYAVVAWLIIEVADTVFPILGIPTWVTTMVVVLIIIGLPVTVVVSWIYQWTPAGIMTEQQADAAGYTEPIGIGRQIDFVIIVLLIIAVGWLVYDKTSVAPVLANSIAVLPFVNMSPDPEQEYFSDGLSEDILNLLTRIPDLKVIARTSSFSFKGKNEDVRVIGQTLGVKTVLEGSVRKSGDRVRITAQLIDVSDGTHIWSETYDRTMTEIFAVQDDVAAAIIDALQIHIGVVPTRGHPTENPDAYALFLKARVFINSHKGIEAIELLRQVTELDPDFAEAHELLAASYWSAAGGTVDATEAFMLMGEAAANALAINPDLPFAQALYDISPGANSPYRNGIEAFERAWRAQPGNSAPLRPLIYELSYAGYQREAHRIAKQYVELDPLSPGAIYTLGETLYAMGQSSEALGPLTIAYDLGDEFASWFLPSVHLIEGRDEIAIALFEAELERIEISDTAWFRDLVAGGRDPVTGQAYLDHRIPQIVESIPDENVLWWRNTLINLYLIFGFLDRYYEVILAVGPDGEIRNDTDVRVWEATLFRTSEFTSHPRYIEVAELLGITRIWEQRGPPDFCDKLDGKWVCE